MATWRVLLIDDDPRLHDLLGSYLQAHDIELCSASSGEEGLGRLHQEPFDAVLCDIMMPGIDGLEVLRRARARHRTPIIMLTARGDDTDRIIGLEMGADDYVPKPFNPRELLARIRAVLRRARPSSEQGERLMVKDLVIDLGTREVQRNGEEVVLTGAEFDILVALARRAGRVVAREALLSAAGRDDVVVNDRTVDVHISHLRQKLGDEPRAPSLIKTVRGVGYVLTRG